MKKAIYMRFVIIILIAVLSSGIVSTILFELNDEKQTKEYLSQLTYTISSIYEIHPDVEYLSSLTNGDRVTLIASDGVVKADSETDASTMENHKDREEVKNAVKGRVITSSRKSKTFGEPFMYAAIKMDDGNILRISRSYAGFYEGSIHQLPSIILPTLIALLIAIFVSRTFTKKLISPLENIVDDITTGNYEKINQNKNRESYYEIDKISNEIRDLLNKINQSKEELILEKEKIPFILSNMSEGFILLDEEKNILLINNSAKEIFECSADVVYQNIIMLTRNPKIEKAVNDANQNNISSVFDLPVQDKIYSVHVSFVCDNYLIKEDKGITLLFVDVTTEYQSQKIRSEFFANASHELKTPMTSVIGFTEMLEHGLLDGEQSQEIYQRIISQTRKMSNLINDILTISRLESGVTDNVSESKYLHDMINQIVATLSPQAQELNVSINVECENIVINANSRKIGELISNLMENAIKYNIMDGSVMISVTSDDKMINITVCDTGIGIPIKDQNRIFERFYRVDYERTKYVDGTGLGLSIVKHIVLSLGGEITLESKVDVGTRITVELPK